MSKQVRKARVLSTEQITPHLQRITVGSDEFKGLTPAYTGNYVKVLIPRDGATDAELNVKTACMRSYTIRHVDPGPKKLDNLSHSHYVLLGDLTSVNAIKAYLEHLPASARIDAFVHVPTELDIIDLNTSRAVNWVVTHTPDTCMSSALNNLECTAQAPVVFMALEAGLVRKLKTRLDEQYAIPRGNIVASGYWKKGFNAERYKQQRQQEAEAV